VLLAFELRAFLLPAYTLPLEPHPKLFLCFSSFSDKDLAFLSRMALDHDPTHLWLQIAGITGFEPQHLAWRRCFGVKNSSCHFHFSGTISPLGLRSPSLDPVLWGGPISLSLSLSFSLSHTHIYTHNLLKSVHKHVCHSWSHTHRRVVTRSKHCHD
jgi:hypothetical protein